MTDAPEDEVAELRARIAELDSALIALLGRRFGLVRRLGRAKARAGEPVENPAREADLRALYLAAAGRAGLDPALVLAVFEAVHRHSKRVQRDEGARPAG